MPTFSLVVAADSQRGIGYQGGIPWKLRRDMGFFKKLTCAQDPKGVEREYEFYPEAPKPSSSGRSTSGGAASDKQRTSQSRNKSNPADSPGITSEPGKPSRIAPSHKQPNAVIMGYRTWESLPQKFKPLPGRLNLVMTRQERPEEHGSRFPGAELHGPLFCNSLEAALSQAEEKHCPNTYVIGGAQIYQEAIRHPGCQSLYITALSELFSCDTFFPEYERHYRETRRSPVFQEDGIPFRFKVFERT